MCDKQALMIRSQAVKGFEGDEEEEWMKYRNYLLMLKLNQLREQKESMKRRLKRNQL